MPVHLQRDRKGREHLEKKRERGKQGEVGVPVHLVHEVGKPSRIVCRIAHARSVPPKRRKLLNCEENLFIIHQDRR